MSFKTWEEYTPLEQAAVTYSDLYKDVHGIRPRFTANWSLAQYEEAFLYLTLESDAQIEREREQEAEAIKDFETLVAMNIEIGAGDRETAIRWIIATFNEYDQEYIERDPSYLNWEYGMPHSYNWKAGKELA
ncbi:MAG: hypothetical protein LC650_04550 [Actinobacteria bacterium]|nr:hypothetical protein [Actinomycetota bacterium]